MQVAAFPGPHISQPPAPPPPPLTRHLDCLVALRRVLEAPPGGGRGQRAAAGHGPGGRQAWITRRQWRVGAVGAAPTGDGSRRADPWAVPRSTQRPSSYTTPTPPPPPPTAPGGGGGASWAPDPPPCPPPQRCDPACARGCARAATGCVPPALPPRLRPAPAPPAPVSCAPWCGCTGGKGGGV